MSNRVIATALAIVLLWANHAYAQATPWVDITLYNGHLFVKTEISGIPGYSMIDTGAGLNGINGNFLANADVSLTQGKKTEIWGLMGKTMSNTYTNVPVTLLGAELSFTELVEIDFGPPENQLILGAGFLQLLVFQFDYPNHRMRAMSRDTIDLKKHRNVKTRQDPMGAAPLVRVRLNDEEDVWLLIDTGSNGGVFLDRKIAERLGWLERYQMVDSETTGINSSGQTEVFNLPVMEFGGFEIENPIITVPADGEEIQFFARQSTTGTRLRKNYRKAEGILGYDVLKHFVVTIDYKTGYLHIVPGSIDSEYTSGQNSN